MELSSNKWVQPYSSGSLSVSEVDTVNISLERREDSCLRVVFMLGQIMKEAGLKLQLGLVVYIDVL